MRLLLFTKTCIFLIIASFLSGCGGDGSRIVAEVKKPIKVKIIETTVWAIPAERPYAFFKKEHRKYEIEIVSDSTTRFQIDYERAYHDPVPWKLQVSDEMIAYQKGDSLFTFFPLIAPMCSTTLESIDKALTLENYAYYSMICEPVLMVQHVSEAKSAELLIQSWAEGYFGNEDPKYDPWLEAYGVVSERSRKIVRDKMIEIFTSLTSEEKENASQDFLRRYKLLESNPTTAI